ncbi:MAG: exosortase K [Myxococcales bacterium]|nr:exosortase K [Myxococcales bacterium]
MTRAARHAADGLVLLALACAAYALKRFYSGASAAELLFILSPTARVVELATATAWRFEAGVGFVSVAHATAIVPACAGINFVIAATATLSVGFLGHFGSLAGKVGWALAAVAMALITAPVVNAIRILADLALRDVVLANHLHASAHRGLGVMVYFGATCLLYTLADRLAAFPSMESRCP